MEDAAIIELYWRRSEAAIPATAEKYSAYCASIALGILGSPEDTEECLNDTWLGAWNAIPPHRPAFLVAFLGKITRNLAINRRQAVRAEKRGGGTLPAVLEELEEIVSGTQSPEDTLVLIGDPGPAGASGCHRRLSFCPARPEAPALCHALL